MMIKYKSICDQTLKSISSKTLRLWCTSTQKEPKVLSGDFFSEEKEKSISLKRAEQLNDYSTSCTICTASRMPWSEFDEDFWICADVEETCCNWICSPRWAWESPPTPTPPPTTNHIVADDSFLCKPQTFTMSAGASRGLRLVLHT